MECNGIGIIGAGNAGRALAAYLSGMGHEVRLCTRDPGQIEPIRREGRIRAHGVLDGVFPIAEVTAEPATLAGRCEVIFVASITTAYRDIARQLAPYLNERHLVILFSGKLCGTLEFLRALSARGCDHTPVVETDSLFDCRCQGDDGIWVRGFKRWTFFSGAQRSDTRRHAERISAFFPGLEAAHSLVQRGLTDFGALAHAVISLVNLSKIDRAEPLRFYYDGLSERTVALLEAVEREFRAVAEAFGSPWIHAKDVLDRYYGCDSRSLLAAMRTVPNYRHSFAPTTIDHRFLREDVVSTLVPLRALADKAGVDTPMIDAVVTMVSILLNEDFKVTGRSLQRLGWQDLSHQEIMEWMHQ